MTKYITIIRTGPAHMLGAIFLTIKKGECTVPLVRAVLDNLSPASVPEDPFEALSSEESHQRLKRSLASLRLLMHIARNAAVDNARLLKETVSLIVTSLEGIIQWANVALNLGTPMGSLISGDFPTAYIDICEIFSTVQLMDQRIQDALASSKSYAQLLIKIWTTPLDSGGRKSFCMNWEDPSRCPLNYLFKRGYCTEEGKRTFVEELIEHDLVESFARATIQRVIMIGEEVEKPNCPDGFEVCATDCFTHLFQKFGLSSDIRLRPSFRRHNYMSQLMNMANKISLSLAAKESLVPEKAEKIVILSMWLIHNALSNDPHTVQNLRDLLDAGYLEMLARVVVKPGPAINVDNPMTYSAIQSLGFIAAWAVYPPICKALARYRDSDPLTAGIDDDSLRVQTMWGDILPVITDRVDSWSQLSDTGFPVICDNLRCARADVDESLKPRQCGRCYSVVYCSTACQRADWEVNHRLECPQAHVFYFGQRDAGRWYGHRWRAFHTKFIETQYQRIAEAIDEIERGRPDPNGIFPSFNFEGWDAHMEVRDLTDVRVEQCLTKPDAKYPQIYFESRLRSLLQNYRSGSMPPDVRLAEGVFILGAGVNHRQARAHKFDAESVMRQLAYGARLWAGHRFDNALTSSVIFKSLFAAGSMILRPTSVLPVNATSSIFRFDEMMASPTVVTTFTTPAGRPALSTREHILSAGIPEGIPKDRKLYCVQREDRAAALKRGPLRKVENILLTLQKGECTVPLVQAIVDNIDVSLVPEDPSEAISSAEGRQRVKRSIASLRLLIHVARNATLNDPILLEDTAALVASSVEGIIQWANVVLALGTPMGSMIPGDFNTAYFDIAQLFSGIQVMDDSIRYALASSESYAQLLIKLWTTPLDKDGRQTFCMSWSNPADCPLNKIIKAALTIDVGKHMFIETLIRHDLGERFASATVQRGILIGEEVGRRKAADGFEQYATEAFAQVFQRLALPSNSLLRPYFRRLNYISQFTAMSNKISIALVAKGVLVPQKAEKLMVLMLWLVNMAIAEDPHTVRNIRDLVDGGYIEMLARTVANGYANSYDSPFVTNAMRSMGFITTWTLYPSVCKILARHRDRQYPYMAGMNSIPRVRDVWQGMWPQINERVDLWIELEDMSFPNICDNLSCTRTVGDERRLPRQCARCSSVIYCSTECQKTDWGANHRQECAPAHRFHLEQKEEGSWYSHRSRAFQAKMVEKRYQHRAAAIAAIERQGRAINSFFPSFNYETWNERLDVHDFTKASVDQFLASNAERYPQSYLYGRLHSLLEAYASGSMPSNVRLAESVCLLGIGIEVSFLVLLRQVGAQSYESFYSVSRIRHSALDVMGQF
ncbi:hypothetical protein NMY22_g13780 [Coprinellus aureogranulatus]|nr:hypothetical protein NMY22_g13780 [Coprinellus aureogranulatus]